MLKREKKREYMRNVYNHGAFILAINNVFTTTKIDFKAPGKIYT